MYLSELPGKNHGCREAAIEGHRVIGQRCRRNLGVDTFVVADVRWLVKREGGTVTAGNASGINDGAAACVLMEERAARRAGRVPLARLASYAVAGVDPCLSTRGSETSERLGRLRSATLGAGGRLRACAVAFVERIRTGPSLNSAFVVGTCSCRLGEIGCPSAHERDSSHGCPHGRRLPCQREQRQRISSGELRLTVARRARPQVGAFEKLFQTTHN
jgi:hypothetical protein